MRLNLFPLDPSTAAGGLFLCTAHRQNRSSSRGFLTTDDTEGTDLKEIQTCRSLSAKSAVHPVLAAAQSRCASLSSLQLPSGSCNLRSAICHLKSSEAWRRWSQWETSNPERDSQLRQQRRETASPNSEPETRNPKPGTRNPELGTRNSIERAPDPEPRFPHQVRVNHGRLHALVPQQLLHGPDVRAPVQQLRGERMP